MKNYGKKVLSVLLALVMCCSVFAMVDFTQLTAEAETANPTHSYYFVVRCTWEDDYYDGGNSGRLVVYGKQGNGNSGSEATLLDQTVDGFEDGGSSTYNTISNSTYWPTRVYVSANIDNNNNMFYNPQGANFTVDIYVKDENTGSFNRYDFGTFSWSSSTVSGGGGTSGKSATVYCASGIYPKATKVATAKSGSVNGTDTINVTLNATGGANKTQAMNAYVYDQYNQIFTSKPTSWEKSGTTACTTSLSTTGASESNTLTMTATNSTYQKSTCTVKAVYGSLYHQWNVVITPTYKITYNVAGNGGTSAVPGPDNTTNTNTGSGNVTYTIPNTTNYTPKKEKGSSSTGTWTFVGWNGSQSATTGSKAGETITIDSYNDTLYAIFSKTATATFYWYKSDGTRTSSENTQTVYNNATQYTFNVPKSSVPTTFTANGTTYTFAGWAVDSTTKTSADHAASVTTAARDIKNGNLTDSYSFYALYTGSVTLSYNNNGGAGAPASQTSNLTLNCGANTSAANNESGQATFTLNPDNVQMSRYYSSAFIGWKTAKTNDSGVDVETAQYKDATVTWSGSSALPTTITIKKNTTVYATYYDFRYNVKFYDNTGTLLSTQAIRHNFSATAPTMKTDSSDPASTDANSHYVFDHWEYTDETEYKDSDKLTMLVNGYTYEVWGKYVGHKHIWGDPYNIQGATTCTTGQTYKKKCTVCNYARDFETEPLGHEFQVTGVAEPTCTLPGSYGKKICVNCGASDPTYTAMIDGVETVVTDENRRIPALGHLYGIEDLEKDTDGNYILTDDEGNFYVDPITVEATCTTAGYNYYECSRCGNVYRVGNIPAKGHSWVTREALEPTCTEAGYSGYTKCANCGLFLDGEESDLDALGHNYVLVEETDSTCTVAGHYAYYTCDRCGLFFDKTGEDTYTEIEDITTKDKELALHDYQLSDEVIEPTCTEQGHTGAYVCAVCGAVDPERPGATVNAKGHVWEREGFAGFETYAATYGDEYVTVYNSAQPCADPSTTTYKCTDCDETYVVTAALADHVPEAHAAAEATCTAEGNTAYWTCGICGKYFSDEACETEIEAASVVIPKIPHTIITIEGQAPTCTATGIPDCYKCTVCLKLFKDAEGKRELTGDLGTIPALGHNFTDWVVAKEPTDDEAGYKTHRCLRCGAVEREDIPANGHRMTYYEAVEATCTTAGNVAYYACAGCGKNFEDEAGTTVIDNVVVSALGHNLPDAPTETVDATCAAEGYDKYICTRCNHTVIVTIPKISEHGELIPYGENIAATCAAAGQEAGTMCSLCGTVITRPRTIAKLAHTPEAERRDVSDATCTVNGYTGDLYCSECGQIIETGTSIEAAGHTLGALTEVRAATCTEYGEKRRTCANCDYYESTETPVLGHQVVIDRAAAATCTEEGKTEGKHCSRCNAVLVAQETIPAKGHNYNTEVVQPTCTTLGYTIYTCVNGCGDVYRDNYTEKVPHVEGTPATCTEPAKCANCGRPYGSALGHDFVVDAEASTPSTCAVHGKRVYKCTRCPETYTETIEELLAHVIDDSTVTVTYTSCTQPGVVTCACGVCGKVFTSEAPAPGHNYVNGICTQCGQPEPTTPDTPATPTSEKCEKCGLNHNGRTGLWKQDGLFCKIIAFFRNILKIFQR